MAVADYYARNALAAAQALRGFDETAFRAKLEGTRIAVAFGSEAASTIEGRALLDLLVRLLARLYPTLSLQSSGGADGVAAGLAELATSVNPLIELDDRAADVGVVVGRDGRSDTRATFFAGSRGWDAHLSMTTPQTVGRTPNPFGPGAAACLAAANVFRTVFLGDGAEPYRMVMLSTFEGEAHASRRAPTLRALTLDGDTALVGLGAVGNATVWALSRSPIQGRLHLVDHEVVELSNLQRYVLARRGDDGRVKVDLAAEHLRGTLDTILVQARWAECVEVHGYYWTRALVALDSARDRRAVQASLPAWIANAWTQPGDLGVSVHRFGGKGACLACLYLPNQPRPSDDVVVAQALGVPDRVMQVRTLLYQGEGAPRDLLEAVAAGLGVPLEDLLPFEGRPVRSLYTEGVCGGAILRLGQAGTPRPDVHVPLAHQSALAGLLLGAALIKDLIRKTNETTITRIDVMRPLGQRLTQPALKSADNRCICGDSDYQAAYQRKYLAAPAPTH